jgi:fatty-acyl-CoA synthase
MQAGLAKPEVNDSIGSRLLYLANVQPNRDWCTYFCGEESSYTITYGDLCKRSLEYAAVFGSSSLFRKRIAICLYPSLDLHAAFLGAILAGHIPAIMPPFSAKTEPEKLRKTVHHFLESMNPDVIVIEDAMTISFDEMSIILPADVLLVAPSKMTIIKGPINSQRGGLETAFIQHSSGTTGYQKGVALSHASVLNHCKEYGDAILLDCEKDSCVSWLPLYHDMGLIACFITPLMSGISIVEIPTLLWAERPGLLFDAITLHKPTLCWLPNFCYTYLSQSLSRTISRSNWDLRSIRLWTNCSEPILDESHQLFVRTFESIGCDKNSLGASYAMAENVFAVTQSNTCLENSIAISKTNLLKGFVSDSKNQIDTKVLMSCGKPISSVDINILKFDEELVLQPNQIGEIVIRSDFLFTEYWANPIATSNAFTSNGYFRTGDSGFMRDGELFVTGRLKDIIIIQGKNLHLSDVELALTDIAGLVPGRVAAVGLLDDSLGTERLAILAETDIESIELKKKVVDEIRLKIKSEFDVATSIVKLLPLKWLVKSTSGKMARNENREKLMRLMSKTNV